MATDSQSTASRNRASSPYVSTGRGGVGNMRYPSRSRDTDSYQAFPGPDDYSPSRGREVPAQHSEQQPLSGGGRGGIGNVHSPSSGAAVETRNALREEAKYVKEHAKDGAVISQGRGGAGNFSFSRSRSRSKARKQRSQSPETPTGISTEAGIADAATSSQGGSAKERAAQGQGNHHSSGVSKITNLFRRGSREPRRSPELPE